MAIQKAPPYAFAVGVTLSFFAPLFFPEARVIPFASFIALALHRYRLLSILWWALFAGLINDAASLHFRFGTSALCYIFSVLILSPFRRQFIEEKAAPFLFLSYLVAAFSTFFLSLLSLYKGMIVFSGFFSFIKGVFISSFFDAALGFLFTFIPLKIYGVIKVERKKRLAISKET